MMKKTFTLIAIMLLLATQMFAQKLSYQAVIRNSNNELVYNATLTVEVSILGPSQNVLYSQTIQNVTSNQNGLITIQIGDDSPAWRAINWSDATIRSVIKDGTTTVATVNSAVSAVPLAIQTLNGSNGERVQADWEETDQNSPAFIQNKPTIPAAPDLSNYVTTEQLQQAGYITTQDLPEMPTVNNGILTITKGDSIYTFSANTNQNVTITLPNIPEAPSMDEITGVISAMGFLTEETDPNVPAWAKEANKPTYNYSEIQNTPDMPTVNDVTISLTQGNSQLGSFTTNAAQGVTIDIPTQMIPDQVQANWEETDENAKSFIRNKPTIPAAPDLSGYVTDEQLQNAGYLRYESQSLSDVAAYGNDAGSRQLKGLADPTDAQDAVTLSYLTTQLNALQQQLAQLGQVVAAQQAVIDSLTNGGGGNAPVTPTTFTCGDNLIDGSNSYTTHQFGSQCWMTQNLRKVNYPEILSACPDGWYLPNNDDWNTLGSSLTSSSVNFDNGDYWASNTMPWQDADGNSFTLFISPASVRSNSVSITNNGIACEVNDALNGDCRINDYALSVRCVREETSGSDTTGGPTTAQAPSVTSSSADLISENEATLFAYVSNPDNVTITSKGFEYKVSGSANYTTAECYVNSQDDNGFGIYAPLYNLTAGTEYTYRAFVTTAEGTSYGSEGTFTTTAVATPTTFTCGDNLIDGSNRYTTHQFGSQCWMTQNLRNTSGTGNLSYPDVLQACPTGWHLPSSDDWSTLGNHMSSLNYAPSLDFENGDYWTTTNSIMPWQDADGNQFTLVVNWASVRTNNVNPNGANGIACEVNDILSCNCAPADYCLGVRCVREETGGSDTTGGPTTAQAPSVTSSSADLISENEATLFAYVSNPDSVTITSKGFEYKVSGSANYTTVNGNENYHNGTVFGIYAPLYNLTAGTEYTYRAFVTTAEGTNYGSEGTFTTTSTAPTASANVGDILLEDNSWVSPNDFDSTSMTAKGVIFHVDETGQHGWAVNLHNENEGYALAWSVYNQGGVAYNVDVEDLPNYTSYDAALSDTAGYQNTTAIRLAMDYQIFHVASQVNIMEGWYVPACGQVAVLMQNLTNVNSSLVTVNGTEIPTKWIWSSTEYGSDRAWGWNEEGMYNPLKSSGFRVRSIRSF